MIMLIITMIVYHSDFLRCVYKAHGCVIWSVCFNLNTAVVEAGMLLRWRALLMNDSIVTGILVKVSNPLVLIYRKCAFVFEVR